MEWVRRAGPGAVTYPAIEGSRDRLREPALDEVAGRVLREVVEVAG